MARLSRDKRDQIAQAIQREPVPTYRTLAREHDVSVSTVYRVAVDYDLADSWEDRRAQTEAANATNAAQLAEKRQRLAEESVDAAREFLTHRFDRKETAIKGMEGAEIVTLAASAEDYKNTGQAVASLTSSAVQLVRLETDLSGAGQASGLLEQFEAGLRERRQEREQRDTDGDA